MTDNWDKYGRSPDKKTILAIGLPSAGKDSVSGWTETEFTNYCPRCHKKGTLMWGIFYNGTFNGRSEGGSSEGHIFCDGTQGGCDADFSVQGWEHISGSNAQCKVVTKTKKSSKDRALKLKKGELEYTGESSSSSTSTSDSASSIKEAITDVLYNWDGEAVCYIRDDTVYIHQIPSPSDATLSLIEGQNIDMGSVSVTDYNPSSVNYLTSTYKDYILTIQDEYLVKRFGKISSNVKMPSSIKNLEAAKKYLQREWNKVKRDNGHSLELKTYGHTKWKIGEWCRVYLPSFNIDDYMFITKTSQDDSGDSEWTCNLTLVDYPPSFGEPTQTNENNNSKKTDSS